MPAPRRPLALSAAIVAAVSGLALSSCSVNADTPASIDAQSQAPFDAESTPLPVTSGSGDTDNKLQGPESSSSPAQAPAGAAAPSSGGTHNTQDTAQAGAQGQSTASNPAKDAADGGGAAGSGASKAHASKATAPAQLRDVQPSSQPQVQRTENAAAPVHKPSASQAPQQRAAQPGKAPSSKEAKKKERQQAKQEAKRKKEESKEVQRADAKPSAPTTRPTAAPQAGAAPQAQAAKPAASNAQAALAAGLPALTGLPHRKSAEMAGLARTSRATYSTQKAVAFKAAPTADATTLAVLPSDYVLGASDPRAEDGYQRVDYLGVTGWVSQAAVEPVKNQAIGATLASYTDASYASAMAAQVQKWCPEQAYNVSAERSRDGQFSASLRWGSGADGKERLDSTINIGRYSVPDPQHPLAEAINFHECAHVVQHRTYVEAPVDASGNKPSMKDAVARYWPGEKGVEQMADCMADAMGAERRGASWEGNGWWEAGYGGSCSAQQMDVATRVLNGEAVS